MTQVKETTQDLTNCMNNGKVARIMVWWGAIRYYFIPPSIFPAVLGGVISWSVDHIFYPWYFLLVLIGVISNHMGLNMTDDYFDYKYSVDHLKPGEKNPYSGGSGMLSNGSIAPANMFKAFTICYLITISIGVYLTLARGLPILAIGLFGGLCSIFYTAPPISFSHHGFGELGLLINFGTTIGLGSYFVQSQKLTVEAFLATLPLGIMLFSMIVINEIPDYEEDRKAGKLTLVARYGRKAGIKLYIVSWIFTYSVIVVAAGLRIMPAITLITLLSLPFVYRSIKILRKHFDNPIQMIPANLDMIKAHSVTSVLLIAAYSVQGLVNDANVYQLIFILLLLAIVYSPVAVLLIRLSRKQPN